jgi:hypothetical protein
MLMSNSPDISIWKMHLSGREMVTNERLDNGIDARCRSDSHKTQKSLNLEIIEMNTQDITTGLHPGLQT